MNQPFIPFFFLITRRLHRNRRRGLRQAGEAVTKTARKTSTCARLQASCMGENACKFVDLNCPPNMKNSEQIILSLS